MVDNKEKQKGVIQDKKVLLYKLYTILLEHSRPITLEPILLKEEVNNLEKVLKILQSPIKTTLFLSLAYYKTI